MNKTLLLLAVVMFAAFAANIQDPGYIRHGDRPIPGGIVTQTDFSKIEGLGEVNDFVLSEKPELVNAMIISVSTQVVSGTNYYITYARGYIEYKVVVFSQPWTNTMRIISFKRKP